MFDGVPDVAVPEKVLKQAGVGSRIGEGEAASMAQPVRRREQGQGSGLAVFAQEQMDGRAVQGLALLTDKERFHGRGNLYPGALFEPCLTRPTSSARSGCLWWRRSAFQPLTSVLSNSDAR